jgi:hypothetical protein
MQREVKDLENDIQQANYESDIMSAFAGGEQVPNPKRRRWMRD